MAVICSINTFNNAVNLTIMMISVECERVSLVCSRKCKFKYIELRYVYKLNDRMRIKMAFHHRSCFTCERDVP